MGQRLLRHSNPHDRFKLRLDSILSPGFFHASVADLFILLSVGETSPTFLDLYFDSRIHFVLNPLTLSRNSGTELVPVISSN